MSNKIGVLLLALVAIFVLAACGGDAPAAPTSADQQARVKMNADLGSAPIPASASNADGPAARGATSTTSDVAGVCLSPAEADLARQINEYRATKGLPAIAVSKSLTLVAQQHAWDSNTNGQPGGDECNMHSWTGKVNPALQEGTWTEVCYTDDHANAAGIWRKPREIAGYPSDGYENSHWASNGVSPTGSLTGWKNSPGHNAVITEQNGWGPFLALGVGMNGNYAHMWVGTVADPAGVPPVCGGGAAAEPTAVPPAAATAAPAVEPTAVPEAQPTTAPAPAGPAGEILNQNGTIAAGATAQHTFDMAAGRTYTVVVAPDAALDAEPLYACTGQGSSFSGSFDNAWEGEEETLTFTAPSNGSCTVTVGGYAGTAGAYVIRVNAQ